MRGRSTATVKASSGVSLAKVALLAVVACMSVGLLAASAPPPAVAPPPGAAPAPTPGTAPDGRHPFRITGVTRVLLRPDATAPVELTFTNPNDVGLTITTLSVEIGDIRIPGDHGRCKPDNFEIRQFSGSYGFVVGALRTVSLSELGIAAAQWPQLTMINLPINQDICKNATITLNFTGEAAGG